MNNTGFALDTKVWSSAGFYRTVQQFIDRKDYFMTDSFDTDRIAFITNRAEIVKRDEPAELVEVVYGGRSAFFGDKPFKRVKCTPDQMFLTCYENLGYLNYKSDTLIWVRADRLKPDTRLVAEDALVFVKEVNKLKETAQVYSVKTESDASFSIEMGVIVKGE